MVCKFDLLGYINVFPNSELQWLVMSNKRVDILGVLTFFN